MPASKYRYVYPAVGGGWFVKVAGEYLGHASTEEDAATLVQKHTKEMPKLKGGKEEHRSIVKSYKGVCYHSKNKSYVAQHEGKTIGGCHKTAKDAAKALQDHLKLRSTKTLEKSKGELLPDPFRERFRVLQKLYCKKGDQILPGDLEAGVRQYSKKAVLRAFDAEPYLEDLCLMGKYGPVKEQMVVEWRALGSPGAKEHSLHERESFCYKVVERTARHFAGKALPEWIANCGLNVSHHSGFVPLLHRLGLVTSRKSGASKNTSCVLTQVGGSCIKYFTGVEKARKKIRDFIATADAVSAVPVPTTGAEWSERMQGLFSKASGGGKKSTGEKRSSGAKSTTSKPNKYLKKWHLRGRWLLRRKALLGDQLN